MTRQEIETLIKQLIKAKLSTPIWGEQEIISRQIWELRNQLKNMK